jgi:ribosomal protein L16 Arg81 hydroxylase
MSTIKDVASSVRLPFREAVPRVFGEVFQNSSDLFGLSDALGLFEDDRYRNGEFAPGHEMLSLVRDQALVPDSEYARIEDARRIREGGATVMFRSLHRRLPKPRALCQEFADLTGIPTFATGYWTPENNQGFPLHSDSDSVAVFQIAGKKTWPLFKPKATADVNDDESLSWVYEGKDSQLAAPLASADNVFTLTPGQVLLVPRGWAHYALTDGAESLHVSIGFLHPEIGEKIHRQEPVWPSA